MRKFSFDVTAKDGSKVTVSRYEQEIVTEMNENLDVKDYVNAGHEYTPEMAVEDWKSLHYQYNIKEV